jgi:glycosyltransferase involved in cell wall biosynthesis
VTSVSIITATFNCDATVRNCIGSVRGQSHPAEHIVVDGGSTDGTLQIVNGCESGIAKVISETDQGVYDAMNKGVALATGDVIGILNADDVYAHRDVLAKVARVFEDERVDSCYGDLVYLSQDNPDRVVRFWRAGPYDVRRFYRGWMPPHPTFFVRRSVYERYGAFRLENGSAADYELMLRFLLKHGISTAYIPEVLVKMRSGGVSNASLGNRLRANRMDRRAWRVNGLRPRPWTIAMKPLSKIGQYLFR